MKRKQLSADLVMPVEKLFQIDLAGLKQLDQQMFELTQREPEQLMSQGAYYSMMFEEQRVHVVALTKFCESHPNYQPLSQGQQLLAWLKLNNQGVINVGALNNAWNTITALDHAEIIQPPRITRQPSSAWKRPALPPAFSLVEKIASSAKAWVACFQSPR